MDVSIHIPILDITLILHELEGFICKALKGEAIVNYCESLITQHMKPSGSPFR